MKKFFKAFAVVAIITSLLVGIRIIIDVYDRNLKKNYINVD